MSWLYQYEAKGIQAYLLGTERLREITGASSRLEALTLGNRERAEQLGAKVLVSAAGKATYRFEGEGMLRGFADDFQFRMAGEAPGLTFVHAWVSEAPGVDAIGALSRKVAEARNRPLVELPEVGPLIARAGRTGRPAVRRGRKAGLQDAATAGKVGEEREHATDLVAVRLGLDAEACIKDTDDFGEGYLAVVHADGNAVGQRIQAISAKERESDWMSAFSTALAEATEAAARAAVQALRQRFGEEARNGLPLRPLVLGGDDFTVLVPARHAVAFTENYLLAFEREAKARATALRGPLTASAGIAIVKNGFPFHSAHLLAEELCKEAKRRFRMPAAGADPTGLPPPSALAFYRVTTAMFESLERVKEDEAVVQPIRHTEAKESLFGGPFTLAELRDLRELAEATKKLPRGALRGFLREVRVDRSRAWAGLKRTREVLSSRGEKSSFDSFTAGLEKLQASVADDPSFGFVPGRRCTPLLDALTWQSVAGGADLLWTATGGAT